MTLSVDAISFGSIRNRNSQPERNSIKPYEQRNSSTKRYENNVSNNQMRNATKAMILGVLALPIAGAGLTGCDAEASAYAENKDTAKIIIVPKGGCDSCCKPVVIHTKDTIRIPEEKWDTVYIDTTQRYPILDSINSILDSLDIERKGRYPLKISYVDEMNTEYKQHLLDQRKVSPEQALYKTTRSPWSDDEGRFVVGSGYDKNEMYLCSLTGDGKVMAMKFVPKIGVNNPQGFDDYAFAFDTFIFDKDRLEGNIKRYLVDNNSNKRTLDWTLNKGDMPNSIMITNPYGANWRLANVKVNSGEIGKDSY